MTDRLLEIFKRQEELEDRYAPIEDNRGFYVASRPLNIQDRFDQEAFRIWNQFLVEELFEATGLLKNKPWKQTEKLVDEPQFDEEMSDAVHFFLKLWLLRHGTAEAASEALYRQYMGKSEINKQRQETNY